MERIITGQATRAARRVTSTNPNLMDTPAEGLAWVEPTEGDLTALAVHHQLERINSVYTITLDLELDRRLEALLTLEAAIVATGGRRNDMALRRAQRLINRARAEFLQTSETSGHEFTEAVLA